jgi:hypothetical protein
MVTIAEWNVDEFRERIRKLTDAELIRYGKAARYMADPRQFDEGQVATSTRPDDVQSPVPD